MRVRVLGFAFLVACAAFGQSITATKAYVDRRYTEATNAVPAIVTNEVSETVWSFSCDIPEIQAALDANPPKVDIVETDDPNVSYWVLHPLPAVSGYGENGSTMETVTDPDVNIIVFSQSYVIIEQGLTIPVTATRSRITRNELGLARLKDLEKLPDHETVTNVARAVSNSFWDERNEVLWRMEFRDGEPMFVPITNENVKATGGAL